MKLLVYSLLLLFICSYAQAQDNCSAAITLCANSTTTRTTAGATASGTDPVLGCGDGIVDNSVWFLVSSHNVGTATITVTNIDNNPGLAMEIYTGACGALTPLGFCTTGSSATGGSMSITFPTVGGTQYYIMVDGESGNQEGFNIVANTPDDAIIARPDANFNTNPNNGCAPLDVNLTNTTTLHGGSNITYEWRIDAGAYLPATGADTLITLNTIGLHSITLRVCNTECGCKSVSQDITVQELYPSITYNPAVSCPGTPIFFDGDAVILPDPPYLDPNITDWTWDFGDPNSGVDNTASGQNVSHIFTSTSSSYTVTLVVDGVCGPETTTTVITLLPKPFADPGPLVTICEGNDANLSVNVVSASPVVSVDWFGPGSFDCTSCYSPVVSGLTAGGPYTMFVSVTDSLGCVADTFVDVVVNEIPTVFAGFDQQFCPYDTYQIIPTVMTGTAPFTYSWSPTAGLSDSTSDSPIAFDTDETYCVTVTDDNLCVSNPSCITLSHYPPPTISSANANLCVSQNPLQNVFTVTGAGPGSTYEWGLSPDYGLITAAAGDSSDITADFPLGVVATYFFTCIVTDAVTGCIDTVTASFDVINGLTMSVSGPAQVCDGDSVSLTASGATDYFWSSLPPYPFADPTLATQVVTPTATTVFTIDGVSGTCTETITYTVTVNPPPVVSVAPVAPICGCQTVNLNGVGSTAGMIYTWTNTGSSVITDPSLISTTATVCANDTFNLNVRDSGTGCFSDSAVAVVILPKPIAVATVTPDLICLGVTTTITLDGTGSDTNPGTTYQWTSNDPGLFITNDNNLIATADVNAPTIFYLLVTDGFGCDSIASDTVQIQTPPTISATPQFMCLADPVLQSVVIISGAASGSTYNWTAVPGCTTPNTASGSIQNFDFAACGVGTYVFDVTVTDSATACIYNLSQSVFVVDSVSLVVTPDTTFCEGGIAFLYASGANTYTWSNGTLTDTMSISGLTAVGSPYNYSVTGTVGTCSATRSVQVTVNPLPVTNPISGPAQVCINDTSSYYSVTPSGGNYTWTIAGGTILSGQGTDSIRIQWSAVGLGTIDVVDTNAFGCAGNVQNVSVIINPLPVAPTITGPISVCEGTTMSYAVTPTAGSLYYWDITGGTYAIGQTGVTNSFIWGVPGPGFVTAYEVSAAGCQGPQDTLDVTINPKPAPIGFIGSTLICDNVTEVYALNTPLNVGSTYTWSAITATSTSVNAVGDSLTVVWGTPGTGIVNVFETNSFGCNSDTSVYNIVINEHPIASILPDSSAICNNVSFQVFGTINTGTLSWFSDGGGTFDDTLSLTPTYTPSATDTGCIHLYMVLTNFPCPNDTAEMALYVSPAPTLVATAAQGTICWGQSDTLNATGGSSYVWGPNGETDSTIYVSPLVTTTYTIDASNIYGCTTTDSVTVIVIPPGIPAAGSDQILCVNDTITLNGTQQNAGGVIWTTAGDGTFDPAANVQDVTYLPGTNDTTSGSVMIFLTTTGACLNLQDTMMITINHPSTILAGNDTLILNDNGVTIPLAPTATNVSGVTWTSSGTGSFSPSDTSLNAVYTPSAADYTLDSLLLTVTTSGGCGAVTDYLVVEFAPFVVPNVFTPYPSSPGQNDYFVISNIPANTKLFIYDRWGLMVYKSDYYQNNWDAYGLKSDVYYYVVEIPEPAKVFHGAIQVIREKE
ncbi:MAG: gliding motility-associated C-terminal domain-containing protein [Bacteroidetes bacterium]|nr:gliding motility-associated C-terminal domain-containing protein [Bacteroidota bacterium]